MTVFDERPTVPFSRQKLRLIALPILAGLVWAGLAWFPHPHRLQQTLQEFRGEAPVDPGPDRSMDSSLTIRRFLLTHTSPKLSLRQGSTLIASAAGPPNDQAQSEALDVLSLALRAHALSSAQTQQAQEAAILVLQNHPGPMVRLESARLLGHLGDRSSTPALLALQQDNDPKVRDAAGEALTRVQRKN